MFCALSRQKVFQPLFFAECTVRGTVYPDMVYELLVPILKQIPDDMQFQQDGMPSQFYKEVTDFLNTKFPVKQIDWSGPSLGHLTHLTLLALIFFVAVHQ
jgi:hypothetical protein